MLTEAAPKQQSKPVEDARESLTKGLSNQEIIKKIEDKIAELEKLHNLQHKVLQKKK